MKDIVRLIQEKREELKKLEADLETLERARQMLGRGSRATPARTTKKVRATRRRRRKRGRLSIPEAAERVLKKNGGPLHVNEIAERAKALGVSTTPHNVATSLQRYLRSGKRFKRTAPGTFALSSPRG